MSITIRTLRADEIEVRVQSTKENTKGVGAIMLLYKDARCDMRILDETFGVTGWQRTHELINGNLFCNIEIWDSEKKCWIRKQDVGTESNTEKEKGQASDSFKRAGFNIGIGRELYTSPFIWINLNDKEWYKDNKGNIKVTEKFDVFNVNYDGNREIIELSIVDKSGTTRYSYRKSNKKVNLPITATQTAEEQLQEQIENKKIDKIKLQSLQELIDKKGANTIALCKKYQINSLADMTIKTCMDAVNLLESAPDKKQESLGL